MKTKLEAARRSLAEACEKRDAAYKALEDAPEDTSGDALEVLETTFDEAQAEVVRQNEYVGKLESRIRAREDTPTFVAVPVESGEEVEDEGLRFAAPKGGKTERTYRPDSGHSFFTDMVIAKSGSYAAEARLRQHDAEYRDLTTVATDGGGFAPPSYLQDLWAGLARQGRPFADRLPKRALPPGSVSFSLPRITTGATVAVTATENASVNEVDLVEEVITRTLVTVAGQQDLSMQLFQRSEPAIDAIIFGDLLRDYDNKLDTGLIGGAGTSGTHLGIRAVTGINTVTYTDSTPTIAEMWPKLFDAIQKVASNRFQKANLILMHPRRAAWIASQLSSTFPLLQQGQLQQAGGTQDQGFAQSIAGIPVLEDANILTTYGAGTDEDEIYVLNTNDIVLFEGEPVSRVLSEVGSGTLTVRLQVYGFSLFFAGRYPASITKVSGTGLAAPTF